MGTIEPRITTRHLRLVAAIAEECSLVAAAKRLNMTQSAATKALQAAEQQIGAPLFDRTASGMVPTIYGRVLIEQGRIVLAQIRQAAQQIDDLREGIGGRVAVGTLPAGASVLLPAAIGRLHQARYKIVFSVTEGINETLVPALRRGQLDLVLGRLPDNGDAPDLIQEPLFRDIACVVARSGHPLTKRAHIALADLAGFEWILPPVETTLRRRIEQAFHEANLEGPQPIVETVSLLLIRGLLQATDYLCVWPWQVAYCEAAVGRAAILPVGLPPATEGPIGMTLWREATPSPAVQAFKNVLRAVACELELSPLLERRGIRATQV